MIKNCADEGDEFMQYLLGCMYEYQLGVPQDFDYAVSYYKKSADKGYVFAQSRIGAIYRRGESNVKPNSVQAMNYLRSAASSGDYMALNHLG